MRRMHCSRTQWVVSSCSWNMLSIQSDNKASSSNRRRCLCLSESVFVLASLSANRFAPAPSCGSKPWRGPRDEETGWFIPSLSEGSEVWVVAPWFNLQQQHSSGYLCYYLVLTRWFVPHRLGKGSNSRFRFIVYLPFTDSIKHGLRRDPGFHHILIREVCG